MQHPFPVGTKVVTRLLKKLGTVTNVPISADDPYLVRFEDGKISRYFRAEVTVAEPER